MERWERRDKKKQAERERMPKSGASVRLIQHVLAKRAAEAKARELTSSPRSKQTAGKRPKPR